MKTMTKNTKNVLVCEDDPVQLKILTTLINQAGYTPVAARTPSEAVVAARRCGIDAVLTDVQLQDGNAFDLLGDLRRFGVDAPVLMASAFATDGMKARAREAGVKHFFEKPFDLPKIREQVENVLKISANLNAIALLVEGHAQTRTDYEKTITAAGFKVLAVENTDKAMDAIKTQKIDLVLTDLGTSSAAFVRKASEAGLHVVMMSGDAKREEIRAGYEAGAASLIRKPVDGERLQSFLKESLKSARAARKQAEEKRARETRIASESAARRFTRWIKSWTNAPSRSRKTGALVTGAMAAAALLIGIGVATMTQGAYETADKFEAMNARLEQMAGMTQTPAVAGKMDAAVSRWQAGEQLRLMSEANQVTRRYYEGHLQEMRHQSRTQTQAQAPAPAFVMPQMPVQIKK